MDQIHSDGWLELCPGIVVFDSSTAVKAERLDAEARGGLWKKTAAYDLATAGSGHQEIDRSLTKPYKALKHIYYWICILRVDNKRRLRISIRYDYSHLLIPSTTDPWCPSTPGTRLNGF